jgi:hypothetical protein
MSQPRTDKELMQQWLQPGAIVPVDTKTVRILLDALRERLAQPEQEPIKESSVTHSHLWIGELWRKEKNA